MDVLFGSQTFLMMETNMSTSEKLLALMIMPDLLFTLKDSDGLALKRLFGTG